MGKAEPRQSEVSDIRSQSGTDTAPDQIAAPISDAYRVRARRFGLLLMVASGLVTVGVFAIAWVMIGRLF